MTKITLSTQFSCAHFYQSNQLTEKENHQTFGKCYSPYGHGHDYKFQIQVQIQNPNQDLKPLIENLNKLSEHLDHQHLNFMIPEFKNKVPTSENVALYCLNSIQKQMSQQTSADFQIVKVTLYERPDLWVEIQV